LIVKKSLFPSRLSGEANSKAAGAVLDGMKRRAQIPEGENYLRDHGNGNIPLT